MNTTRILAAAVGVSLLVPSAFGQDAAKIEAEAAKATELVWAKLAAKIDELTFNQVEARDAIQYFREKFAFNVYVDWKSLGDAGVDKSTPVTVKLKDVTVARALRVVLNEIGAEAMDYIVDDGVLVISTRDALVTRAVTRVYPAADLLCRTRRAYTESSGIPWRRTNFLPKEERVALEAEEAGALFGGGFEEEGRSTEEAAMALIEGLQENVGPDTWRPEGEIGSIRVQGTNLVITQTHKNQQEVEAYLRMLRTARDLQQIEVGLAVVRVAGPEAVKRLRKIASAGGDVVTALVDGEDDGQWTLDRCRIEQAILGDVLRATHAYTRKVQSGQVATDTAVVFEHTTFTGYEVGVLPKWRTDEAISMSVACGAGWLSKDEDPRKDTPEANTGVRGRHNVFDFSLRPGEARLLPVIPLTAKDGGVRIIVWAPKKK